MSKRVKIIVSVVAAVFVLSTVGATVAVMAQEGETEPQPAEETVTCGFLTRVAAILGISEETLTGAFRQARQEMTDEALAEERITSEQAGEIKTKWAQVRDRIRHAFIFRRMLRMDEGELDEALARAIEEGRITGEQAGEIKTKWEQARDRIRHAFIFRRMMGMDEGELDEALAEAVDEERITGEQAEQIKARWQQRHQVLEGDSTGARIMQAVGGRRMTALCGGMQRMRLHRLAD